MNFAVVTFLKGTFSITVSVPSGARSLEVYASSRINPNDISSEILVSLVIVNAISLKSTERASVAASRVTTLVSDGESTVITASLGKTFTTKISLPFNILALSPSIFNLNGRITFLLKSLSFNDVISNLAILPPLGTMISLWISCTKLGVPNS